MTRLIEVETASGVECINPEQIVRIQVMRDGAVILYPDGSMSYVLRSEWERIKWLLTIETPQSQTPASADDNNTSSTYDGLPF